MLPLDVEVHQALDVDHHGVPGRVHQHVVGPQFAVHHRVLRARPHRRRQTEQPLLQPVADSRDPRITHRRPGEVPQRTVQNDPLARRPARRTSPVDHGHLAVHGCPMTPHRRERLSEPGHGRGSRARVAREPFSGPRLQRLAVGGGEGQPVIGAPEPGQRQVRRRGAPRIPLRGYGGHGHYGHRHYGRGRRVDGGPRSRLRNRNRNRRGGPGQQRHGYGHGYGHGHRHGHGHGHGHIRLPATRPGHHPAVLRVQVRVPPLARRT